MSSQFLIQCLAHNKCSINKCERRKRKKGRMKWKGRICWVSSVCPSRSTLQPALNPKRLTYMNCLGGLLILWFLVGFGQMDTLADQRSRNGYLFPEIPPCGSLQPSVPLTQPGPRPLPHSSLTGESTPLPCPSDLGW